MQPRYASTESCTVTQRRPRKWPRRRAREPTSESSKLASSGLEESTCFDHDHVKDRSEGGRRKALELAYSGHLEIRLVNSDVFKPQRACDAEAKPRTEIAEVVFGEAVISRQSTPRHWDN